MAIEKDFFRQVMGHFTTGVTVVTTINNGELAGLTVNAFCSVSLKPPLVLICIDTSSQTIAAFRESKTFVVNILTEQQEHLSRCFATNTTERYENFCNASYHIAATGAPVIDHGLAFIDARIIAEYPGGDHIIFLGQVEAMGTQEKVMFVNDDERAQSTLLENSATFDEDAAPLVYYRGLYQHLADQYQKPTLITEYHEHIEEPSAGR